MNLNEAAERKSPWVFGSAKKDLLVFLSPLIAGLVLHALFGSTFDKLKQSITIYGFFYFVLNTGHIFGTAFPILLDGDLRKKIGPRKMWIIPAFVIAFFGTICLYNVILFKKLFGLFTLFHILAQHYNWLKVLQKREVQTKSRQRFERFVFLGLIVTGVSTWISGTTPVSPSYMHHNDIRLSFGFLDLRYLIWPATAVWVGTMIDLGIRAWRSPQQIPNGKILLFATLYPWIFGSLLFLDSALMFFVYVIGSHAMGYYLYLGHGWNRSASAPKIHKYFPIIVPAACAVIGVVWNKTSLFILSFLPPGLLFVIWIPIILHYVYDGTLWKRSKREKGEASLGDPAGVSGIGSRQSA